MSLAPSTIAVSSRNHMDWCKKKVIISGDDQQLVSRKLFDSVLVVLVVLDSVCGKQNLNVSGRNSLRVGEI